MENAPNHMPGPWTARPADKPNRTLITAPDPTDDRDDPQPWNIATVWTEVGYDANHGEANARLIAAGPELLERLAELVGLIDQGYYHDSNAVTESVTLARLAIAKATGT